MAYPAFRSADTINTTTSGSNFVFNKPSGLAEGDYMLVGVRVFAGGGRTVSAPAGWSTLATSGSNLRAWYFFDKTATSGDAAASTFTFTTSGSVDQRVGYMAAFSGVVSRQDFDLSEVSAVGATSGTVSVTPLTNESLAISTLITLDFDLSAILTASAVTLTPTTSMTERIDVGTRNASSGGISAFVYTGEYTGSADITNFAFTVSEPITSSTAGGVIILNGVQNVTADISHLAVTPIIEGVTASVNVATDIGHIYADPAIEGISGKSNNDVTQWTNEPKTNTSWTNEQI